jgi:hypothetical protein
VVRGLIDDDTLRLWVVGYNPRDRREPAPSWGLDGEDVWLPRGLVLPWLVGGDRVSMVKIRRPAADRPRDKYVAVRGGHPLLYGADTLRPGWPAVLCEGELDTLLVAQAAEDRTATVSLGSASRRPTKRGALLLGEGSIDIRG